eukprot:s2054_g5.t1
MPRLHQPVRFQEGVALGDICFRFVWQAWHLVTSAFVLCGGRGTYDTGLALVAALAWRLRHWAGSGGGLGRRSPPVTPRLFCVAGVAMHSPSMQAEVCNKEIGYCQSMNDIVATILLYRSEEETFWTFCSLIEDVLPEGYYTETLSFRVPLRVPHRSRLNEHPSQATPGIGLQRHLLEGFQVLFRVLYFAQMLCSCHSMTPDIEQSRIEQLEKERQRCRAQVEAQSCDQFARSSFSWSPPAKAPQKTKEDEDEQDCKGQNMRKHQLCLADDRRPFAVSKRS